MSPVNIQRPWPFCFIFFRYYKWIISKDINILGQHHLQPFKDNALFAGVYYQSLGRYSLWPWGWAACSKVFVLKLISDQARSNVRLTKAFFSPLKPSNCILLHKLCDMCWWLQISFEFWEGGCFRWILSYQWTLNCTSYSLNIVTVTDIDLEPYYVTIFIGSYIFQA